MIISILVIYFLLVMAFYLWGIQAWLAFTLPIIIFAILVYVSAKTSDNNVKDNNQVNKEKHYKDDNEDDGLEDFIWFNMINKH